MENRLLRIFTKILVCAIFLAFPLQGNAAGISDAISGELEYASSVISAGTRTGDPEKLSEAHRILSNLELSLKDVPSDKERVTFVLALGFSYVDMCPSAFFLQLTKPGNKSGFTINCVEKSLKYFDDAVKLAQNKLTGAGKADACFIAGIGTDRLKANMSSAPGVDTEKFYDKALEYFNCAASGGTTIEGVATILKRLSRADYLKMPVVDDARYDDVRRTLSLGASAFPTPEIEKDSASPDKPVTVKVEKKPKKSAAVEPVETPAVEERSIDENTYLDYKWRFLIRRPSDDWKFVSGENGQSFQLYVMMKNSMEQTGSGISVICSSIEGGDYSLEQVVDRSVGLLQQAGYTLKSKNKATVSNMPAYAVVSEHRYNDLIPSESVMQPGMGSIPSSDSLVSIQDMKIITANGIQYIISFSSLEKDYTRASELYGDIIKTLEIF